MLPRDTAYLTKKGVEFQKGWYILPLNHKLRDLQLKTQKKKVKVSVSYDPYNLNQINILHEGEVIECKLNISKSPIYKDKTMWDIIHLKKARSESINQNNDELTYATINDLEFAANLLKDRKEGVTINKTGSKSVKENREKDKKIGREFKRKESVAKELENRKDGKIISINTKINLDQPDDLDFIDRLLDEE